MQPNPASSTVRGLSIATIILSAIGIVSSLIFLASMSVFRGYVSDNVDLFADLTMSAMEQNATSSITINEHNINLSDLTSALEKQGHADVAVAAELLDDLSNGKLAAAFDLMSTTDANSVVAAKHKFAEMSDDQMLQLANAMSGVTSADIIALRDAVAGIDDSDIVTLCYYLGSSTPEKMISDTVDFVVAIATYLAVAGLISELITLIASILALRNAAKPDKLNAAFVLCIIGAVASLLMLSIIRLILMIIDAVYIQKVRKTPAAPSTYPQGPGQGMPAGWQQNMPQGTAANGVENPNQTVPYPDAFK